MRRLPICINRIQWFSYCARLSHCAVFGAKVQCTKTRQQTKLSLTVPFYTGVYKCVLPRNTNSPIIYIGLEHYAVKNYETHQLYLLQIAGNDLEIQVGVRTWPSVSRRDILTWVAGIMKWCLSAKAGNSSPLNCKATVPLFIHMKIRKLCRKTLFLFFYFREFQYVLRNSSHSNCKPEVLLLPMQQFSSSIYTDTEDSSITGPSHSNDASIIIFLIIIHIICIVFFSCNIYAYTGHQS